MEDYTSAHARSHEDHIRSTDYPFDLRYALLRRLSSNIRDPACAQASRQIRAEGQRLNALSWPKEAVSA